MKKKNAAALMAAALTASMLAGCGSSASQLRCLRPCRVHPRRERRRRVDS